MGDGVGDGVGDNTYQQQLARVLPPLGFETGPSLAQTTPSSSPPAAGLGLGTEDSGMLGRTWPI